MDKYALYDKIFSMPISQLEKFIKNCKSLKTLVNIRGMLTENKKYRRANVLLQQIESITDFDDKVTVTPSVLNNFIKNAM